MLLSGDNSIEILIVILVKRSLRVFIPNPEIHSFRNATKRVGSPGNVGITIGSQSRILRPKAIVLLLRVGHESQVRRTISTARRDKRESFRERHALDVGGSEAERSG